MDFVRRNWLLPCHNMAATPGRKSVLTPIYREKENKNPETRGMDGVVLPCYLWMGNDDLFAVKILKTQHMGISDEFDGWHQMILPKG